MAQADSDAPLPLRLQRWLADFDARQADRSGVVSTETLSSLLVRYVAKLSLEQLSMSAVISCGTPGSSNTDVTLSYELLYKRGFELADALRSGASAGDACCDRYVGVFAGKRVTSICAIVGCVLCTWFCCGSRSELTGVFLLLSQGSCSLARHTYLFTLTPPAPMSSELCILTWARSTLLAASLSGTVYQRYRCDIILYHTRLL
jgi:hypothetical protein